MIAFTAGVGTILQNYDTSTYFLDNAWIALLFLVLSIWPLIIKKSYKRKLEKIKSEGEKYSKEQVMEIIHEIMIVKMERCQEEALSVYNEMKEAPSSIFIEKPVLYNWFHETLDADGFPYNNTIEVMEHW